jgi:hypothetical protein
MFWQTAGADFTEFSPALKEKLRLLQKAVALKEV